jgi:CBS domain containing-hemolysin-like protein
MKEADTSDDPLPRTQFNIANSTRYSYLALGLFPDYTPGDVTYGDWIFFLIAFLLYLLFTSLSATYIVNGWVEMPWDRRTSAKYFFPDDKQKFTLAVLQWLFLVIAIVTGCRMAVILLTEYPDNLNVIIGAAVVWIWIDLVIRAIAGRFSNMYVTAFDTTARIIIQIFQPLTNRLTTLAQKVGLYHFIVPTKEEEYKNYTEQSLEEHDLLLSLESFSKTTVKQAMQVRTNITGFDWELDFHELMDKVNKSGYSRVPVYKETIDSVEGILYTKDLLSYTHQDENFQWQTLLRPAYFIPESKRLDDLLQEFRKRRVHMAIVVDEYGGTSGLITLEDIIEEIFGDINDEYDDAEDVYYNQIDDYTYLFEGRAPVSNLLRIIGLPQDYFVDVQASSESLAGLLLELFSRLPRIGEQVTYRDLVFKIQSADKKKIKKVRILKSTP